METTNASLATDMVLLAPDAAGVWHVLLIERGWDPYAGRWALPGGYVEPHETFAQAAVRELFEETAVHSPAGVEQVGIYDAPTRDPRGRVVSVAFVAVLSRPVPAQGGDDARTALWWSLAEVFDPASPLPLAFDHARILTDAVAVAGVRYRP
ncbi:NUDIX hydrolase [Saccharothrix sp.]|uniref:NUDIX hydrolase n=1 Tax=Saccharothrix sp. TaxID=1873460 RepID=UPI002810E0F1|nr:NUDIX hydrolase [Saccharothrix sp.]